MPATTPNSAIRYPLPSDPPRVQQDLKNLATDVDALIMGIPVGMTCDWDYGAAQIPTWALLLYGQAISRATYSRLHTLANQASYPHGSGDGSTTFNVGDKRGRAVAGKDDMGGTAAGRITAALSGTAGTVLGAAVGTQGVTLSTAQMPSHSHTGSTGTVSTDHAHYGSSGGRSAAHSHADSGHNHNPAVGGLRSDGGRSGWAGPGSTWYAGAGDDNFSARYNGWYYSNTGYVSTGNESSDHGHVNYTGGFSANHTQSISSEGGGGAHMNTQPTIIVNKIVRAL